MIAILFALVLICWGLYEYLKFLKRTFKGIIKDYAKIKNMIAIPIANFLIFAVVSSSGTSRSSVSVAFDSTGGGGTQYCGVEAITSSLFTSSLFTSSLFTHHKNCNIYQRNN